MRINKNDYDNVKLDVERLKAGGHRCIIKQITEGKSQKGQDMLTISFDTTEEDPQPKFYTNDYLGQSGTAKKWHGTSYITQGNEYFLKNLKQFVGAVESSNEGFAGLTDDGIVKTDEFKNKLVGIVFREEEYMANTGRKGTSVKPLYFCNYGDVLEKPIPEKKLLANTSAPSAFTPASNPEMANEGFMQIAPDALEDEGRPFN